MQTYSVGAFLKVILGVGILYILYNYVNIFQHSSWGLGFGFLGVFLVIWGASFFFFRVLWSIFSPYEDHIKSSASYKMSLILGIFTITNLTFMVINQRSNRLGLLFVGIFVLLLYFLTNDLIKQHR